MVYTYYIYNNNIYTILQRGVAIVTAWEFDKGYWGCSIFGFTQISQHMDSWLVSHTVTRYIKTGQIRSPPP